MPCGGGGNDYRAYQIEAYKLKVRQARDRGKDPPKSFTINKTPEPNEQVRVFSKKGVDYHVEEDTDRLYNGKVTDSVSCEYNQPKYCLTKDSKADHDLFKAYSLKQLHRQRHLVEKLVDNSRDGGKTQREQYLEVIREIAMPRFDMAPAAFLVDWDFMAFANLAKAYVEVFVKGKEEEELSSIEQEELINNIISKKLEETSESIGEMKARLKVIGEQHAKFIRRQEQQLSELEPCVADAGDARRAPDAVAAAATTPTVSLPSSSSSDGSKNSVAASNGENIAALSNVPVLVDEHSNAAAPFSPSSSGDSKNSVAASNGDKNVATSSTTPVMANTTVARPVANVSDAAPAPSSAGGSVATTNGDNNVATSSTAPVIADTTVIPPVATVAAAAPVPLSSGGGIVTATNGDNNVATSSTAPVIADTTVIPPAANVAAAAAAARSTHSSSGGSGSTAFVATSDTPVKIGVVPIVSAQVYQESFRAEKSRGKINKSYSEKQCRTMAKHREAWDNGAKDAKNKYIKEKAAMPPHESLPSWNTLKDNDWIPNNKVDSHLQRREKDGTLREVIAEEHFYEKTTSFMKTKYATSQGNAPSMDKLVEDMRKVFYFREQNLTLLTKPSSEQAPVPAAAATRTLQAQPSSDHSFEQLDFPPVANAAAVAPAATATRTLQAQPSSDHVFEQLEGMHKSMFVRGEITNARYLELKEKLEQLKAQSQRQSERPQEPMEKDTIIREKDNIIREKDDIIRGQNRVISEQSSVIKDLTATSQTLGQVLGQCATVMQNCTEATKNCSVASTECAVAMKESMATTNKIATALLE